MARYWVGKGLRLSYILSLLFYLQLIVLPVTADEEYYSGGAEEVAPPPAADPEVVCRNYLVNVRNDMLTQLAAERDRLNGIATCLSSPVDESGTCATQTAGVLETLDQYRDYEANRFLSTVGYDEYRGDAAALLRTNADFGVENTNTALMGGFAPMTHMNPRFQGGFIGDHVQRFQDAQRPHLAGWWQNNITSERFPNWDRCVATNDSGEVQWDSRDGSALLYPQFLDSPRAGDDEGDEPVAAEESTEVAEPTDDGPSDLQTDCDALRAFFQNNPQAIDLTRQVATDSEAALLGAENLQPWHGFLDRLSIIDPDPEVLGQISHEELINLEVARAHNRLASRFVDFEDHVSRWDDDEIMQLLAFDQIRNSPATEQSCPGMEAPSGFQWGDLLHLIPGYSVVAASLDLRNNYTALVVGANGEQTYWQNHGDTSRDLAIGAAAAVPLLAAEAAAMRYVVAPAARAADDLLGVSDFAGRLSAGARDRVREIFRRTPTPDEVGQLGDAGRLTTAGNVLGRELTEPEQAAILRAHYSGSGELGADGINPAGIGNYTPAQLRAKAAELRAAGFSPEETRALMESGVTGLSPQARVQAFRDAYTTGDLSGPNSFISFQTADGGQLAGQIVGVLPDGGLRVQTRNAAGEIVEVEVPRAQLGTVRLSETARLVYERGANPNVDRFRNAVLTGEIDPAQRFISFETPGIPGRYSGEILSIDPQTQRVTIRTQSGETRILTQDELISARTSTTSGFNFLSGSGQPVEIRSLSGNTYAGVADGIETLPNGERFLRLIQHNGEVQHLRLDRLDIGTITERRAPSGTLVPGGTSPGPRVTAAPPQFTGTGVNDYYVRIPGAPITDENYILNAGDSIESFSRFWGGTDRITPDTLSGATREMHVISARGPNGDRPYLGATNRNGSEIPIGEFYVADGVLTNGRPSDVYAQAIADQFNLGEVSVSGRLELPGIPPQYQPVNGTFGPSSHQYPPASQAAYDAYFSAGADVLEGLRGMPRGSDEAFGAIADYYQLMANARPFRNINNSIFMNQTNYLLETYGFQPMSHGYLDHLAMRLSPQDFRRVFRLHMEGRLPLPDPSIRGNL